MAAHDKGLFRQLFPHQGPALEAHGLALVLLGLFGHVPVPLGIVVVPDLHNGGVQVEGQGVLNVVILHLAAHIFIGDIAAAGDGPDDFVVLHFVHGAVEAVEHHQLAAFQLVVHQLAHIAVVAEESGGIGKQKLLIHHPALGHGAVEQVQHPHAVILDDHPLGLCFADPAAEIFAGELALLLHNADKHALVRELVGGVFLLPLLTH